MVKTHINSPSIIMWVVFNEGWGQHDTPKLTKMVKQLDPSRLVSNASGWADKRVGDVNDRKAAGPICHQNLAEAAFGRRVGVGIRFAGPAFIRLLFCTDSLRKSRLRLC